MSVETITLGCRLYFAESGTIARLAPADEDWIVVNSCVSGKTPKIRTVVAFERS